MADTRPARIWGVTSTVSGLGQGLIANSLSWNDSVETADARDENGKLLDIAGYSRSGEITIDGLFVGDGVSAGDKITIGDLDMLVTSSNKNETNTDFQRGSVTARYGDADTVIHPLSSMYALGD